MYESFYGLNMDPFRLNADHRFCFNHPSYIRAKGAVQHALVPGRGVRDDHGPARNREDHPGR
jgi:general secretion pathway protein A